MNKVCFLLLGLLVFPAWAQAAEYPNKPIDVILDFDPMDLSRNGTPRDSLV